MDATVTLYVAETLTDKVFDVCSIILVQIGNILKKCRYGHGYVKK